MKITISFISVVSFSWCIGLKGLIIPENANILSTAGTGIAEGKALGLNPAINVSENSFIQFSLNRWLADIKGSQVAYQWGQKFSQAISIQSWNADDLQLWGDKPDTSPLGEFGVHFVSIAYGISHDLNTSNRFGIRILANYNHLYIESMRGITLDMGALFPIGSLLTAGITVKNVGYEYTNNLRANLPREFGLGTKWKLPFKISLLADAIYLSEKKTDIRMGLRTHYKFLNVNCGVSISEKRNAHAFGFSLRYHKWFINYGVYNHENSIFGQTLPQFLDVRCYL